MESISDQLRAEDGIDYAIYPTTLDAKDTGKLLTNYETRECYADVYILAPAAAAERGEIAGVVPGTFLAYYPQMENSELARKYALSAYFKLPQVCDLSGNVRSWADYKREPWRLWSDRVFEKCAGSLYRPSEDPTRLYLLSYSLPYYCDDSCRSVAESSASLLDCVGGDLPCYLSFPAARTDFILNPRTRYSMLDNVAAERKGTNLWLLTRDAAVVEAAKAYVARLEKSRAKRKPRVSESDLSSNLSVVGYDLCNWANDCFRRELARFGFKHVKAGNWDTSVVYNHAGYGTPASGVFRAITAFAGALDSFRVSAKDCRCASETIVGTYAKLTEAERTLLKTKNKVWVEENAKYPTPRTRSLARAWKRVRKYIAHGSALYADMRELVASIDASFKQKETP